MNIILLKFPEDSNASITIVVHIYEDTVSTLQYNTSEGL